MMDFQLFSNGMHALATYTHSTKDLLTMTPAELDDLPHSEKTYYSMDYSPLGTVGHSIKSRQTMLQYVEKVMIATAPSGQTWYVIWSCYSAFPNWFIPSDEHVLTSKDNTYPLIFARTRDKTSMELLCHGYGALEQGVSLRELIRMSFNELRKHDPIEIADYSNLPGVYFESRSFQELEDNIDDMKEIGYDDNVIWHVILTTRIANPAIFRRGPMHQQ
jgi:hypothetical protein